MDTSAAITLKPIGHMKSVFHFKNGTPRQSSLCQNARGILVIEKSVFTNPEHSLDGLQHYSHAWILFVFHKNNNAHKKAKVKPPRLDGQRVGVFSTRSPYRPNNIGLSLAKIDKIQGASIHFSGIDILDGTPILDIKPYIPEYDKPATAHDAFPLLPNDLINESKLTGDSTTNPVILKTDVLADESPLQNQQQEMQQSSDTVSKSSHSVAAFSEKKCESLEEGLYSLSAALDKAGETLKGGAKDKDSLGRLMTKSVESRNVSVSGSQHNDCGDVDDSERNDKSDDDLLDFLVGNVICQAASDVLSADSSISEVNSNVACGIDSTSSSFDGGSIYGQSVSTDLNHSREIKTVQNCDSSNNSAVTAPWLSSPPVAKVQVVFSAESLDQLQNFHNSATDTKYRTEMLSGPEDAKEAIKSVLHEEPRSVYRRQKCQNSVYFFAIDVLHVTCWFDGDAVMVLRIRPVADVPQLQGKK